MLYIVDGFLAGVMGYASAMYLHHRQLAAAWQEIAHEYERLGARIARVLHLEQQVEEHYLRTVEDDPTLDRQH